MRNGGYQIIDFKNVNFTSGQVKTFKASKLALYDVIESTNKRTIVSGLVVDSIEFDDMEVHFAVSSESNFIGTVYVGAGTVQIRIAPNNAITVTRTV